MLVRLLGGVVLACEGVCAGEKGRELRKKVKRRSTVCDAEYLTCSRPPVPSKMMSGYGLSSQSERSAPT